MVYREPYLPLRVKHASEITPSNRKIRSRLNRLQVASLEKQNAIYNDFIRELRETRAARYARPPIVAPQLFFFFLTHSLSHSLSVSYILPFFLSLFFSPLFTLSTPQIIYLIVLCLFCFLSSHVSFLFNFNRYKYTEKKCCCFY